jgi:hypothetical protein
MSNNMSSSGFLFFIDWKFIFTIFNGLYILFFTLISELPFFAWCAIGEEQACGFPGLSIF